MFISHLHIFKLLWHYFVFNFFEAKRERALRVLSAIDSVKETCYRNRETSYKSFIYRFQSFNAQFTTFHFTNDKTLFQDLIYLSP